MSTGSEPHHPAGSVDPPGFGPGDDAPNRERGARAKNALAVVGILALLASAVVGSDAFGLRGRIFGSARPDPRPRAVSRRADAPTETTAEPQKTVLRSQPWWQTITTLTGVGPMTAAAFDISGDAVQWRVKWTCQEVTVGSLNFSLPPDVDPKRYKSVVIWCRLINSAYSGATLRRIDS